LSGSRIIVSSQTTPRSENGKVTQEIYVIKTYFSALKPKNSMLKKKIKPKLNEASPTPIGYYQMPSKWLLLSQ